jgi:hypothetical protein
MDSRARRVLGGFVVGADLDVVRPVNFGRGDVRSVSRGLIQ